MIQNDFSFFWHQTTGVDIPNKKKSINNLSYKLLLLSGIALAALSLAVWNIIQQRPFDAFKNLTAGVCLEIILMRVFGHKAKPQPPLIDPKEETTKAHEIPKSEVMTAEPEIMIDDLDACYPIPAIDPIQTKNKQVGGLFGQACGDAIGLFTEFTTKQEAQQMIAGKNIEFSPKYPEEFQNGFNWGHIKRFVKNGWTDDTDQALSLIRALYRTLHEHPNKSSQSFDLLFAEELKKWRLFGLREEAPFIGRNKPYCMGLGALVSAVLEHPLFLENPKKAAKDIWAGSREIPLKDRPAANGALMRTAPIGLIFYKSLKDVIFYTIEACKVTHADPRCIVSCVAFTLAIALSLRGYDSETILKEVEKRGLMILRQELNDVAEQGLLSIEEMANLETLYEITAQDFKAHLHGDWETLDLDEGYRQGPKENKIGYTFKCMGAAFYALRLAAQKKKENQEDIFRTIIEMIAAEGGDADTNGAAAGALIGAYLGFKNQMPKNWTQNLADRPVLKQAIQHIDQLSHE